MHFVHQSPAAASQRPRKGIAHSPVKRVNLCMRCRRALSLSGELHIRVTCSRSAGTGLESSKSVETPAGLMVRGGRSALLAIVGAGIALRLLGLGWGIPQVPAPDATAYRTSFHFDEHTYIQGVLNINPATWDYDVKDYHWGTLQFYLVAAALKAARICGYLSQSWRESFAKGNEPDFARVYIAGRAVSALTGILTILAAFVLGRRLKNSDAGLIAAAFISVLPLHLVNSHFLTSDVTMVFLSLVSVYCFMVWLERGDLSARLAGAFALGLAVSAKYNALFLVPFWAAADTILLWRQKRSGAPALKGCALGYGVLVAGFAIGEPYAFIHMSSFIETIRRNYFSMSQGVREAMLPWPRLLFEQLQGVLRFGMRWTLALPACGGIVLCFARPTRQRLALAGFILMTWASLVLARWPMIRYTLPMIALASIAAALLLAELPVPRPCRLFAAAILCVLPLMVSWAQVNVMLDKHTANCASDWINEHIPAGSRIGQIWPEMPPLDRRRYHLHQLHGLFGNEPVKAEDLDWDYVILDNLPIQPFDPEFLVRLARNYLRVAEFHREPHIGSWVLNEQNAPHDWKYTHPTLTIYQRRTGTTFDFR